MSGADPAPERVAALAEALHNDEWISRALHDEEWAGNVRTWPCRACDRAAAAILAVLPESFFAPAPDAEHRHDFVRRDGWWCACGEPFRSSRAVEIDGGVTLSVAQLSSDYRRGYADGFDAEANVSARNYAAAPAPDAERLDVERLATAIRTFEPDRGLRRMSWARPDPDDAAAIAEAYGEARQR